tara:strand:+ start:154 stop:411 length:258 start_codon:yes stop_codon:yes gene_type:complete
MMKKKVNKLWRGKFVSIRDYEIRKAIKYGGMELEHEGKVMRLTVEDLRTITPTGKVFTSKFGGSYQLADVTWTPLTHDPNQGDLI